MLDTPVTFNQGEVDLSDAKPNPPGCTLVETASERQQEGGYGVGLSDLGLAEPSPVKSPLQIQQIPNIWSHSYQMGSQPFVEAIVASQQSTLTPDGFSWIESNSPFSDHIQAAQAASVGKTRTAGSHR